MLQTLFCNGLLVLLFVLFAGRSQLKKSPLRTPFRHLRNNINVLCRALSLLIVSRWFCASDAVNDVFR